MSFSPVEKFSDADPKSTFDVIQKMVQFMRSLSLIGNDNYKTKKISSLRFLLFLLSYMTINVACILCRVYLLPTWQKTPWSLIVYLELAFSCIGSIFVIMSIIHAYRTKVDDYQEFYSNYAAIDSILIIKLKPCYTLEKTKLEKLFFISVSVFFTKTIGEPIWMFISDLNPIYGVFLDYGIANLVMFIVMAYILINVMVFRERFEMFTQEVIFTFMERKNTCSSAAEKLLQFKRCYQLLYKQNSVLSKWHGWQILLILAQLLLFLTKATYSIMTESPLGFAYARFILIWISGGVLVQLATIIENVSDIRTQLLMHIEEALVCLEEEIYGNEEYRHLTQFLGQVRRQPLEFYLCNMYCLDYRMLQAVISFTVTYTVILAQLNIKM